MLTILTPTFFVLALGYAAWRYCLFDGEKSKGLTELVLDFALPVALFIGIVTSLHQEILQVILLFQAFFFVLLSLYAIVFIVTRFIFHKTNHKRGCRHDYNIYKNNHPFTPKQVVNVFDLGYLGVEKDFPGQLSALPYKNQRNQQELSAEEKDYNTFHSKKRIVMEHTICRLKKYRIFADIFRNKLRRYSKVSDIVSGLVNYRIMNCHN